MKNVVNASSCPLYELFISDIPPYQFNFVDYVVEVFGWTKEKIIEYTGFPTFFNGFFCYVRADESRPAGNQYLQVTTYTNTLHVRI